MLAGTIPIATTTIHGAPITTHGRTPITVMDGVMRTVTTMDWELTILMLILGEIMPIKDGGTTQIIAMDGEILIVAINLKDGMRKTTLMDGQDNRIPISKDQTKMFKVGAINNKTQTKDGDKTSTNPTSGQIKRTPTTSQPNPIIS